MFVQLEVPAEVQLTVFDRDTFANISRTQFRWKTGAIKPGQTERIRVVGKSSKEGAAELVATLIAAGQKPLEETTRFRFSPASP